MARFIQYMTKDSLYDGPFDDKSGWPAAGMGYVTVTEGGGLIVVDGGQPNDAESFFELLSEQGMKDTVAVDTWIITHAHLDHYGALLAMCENYELAKRLKIKSLVYLYPDDFYNKNGTLQSFADQDREMKKVAEITGAECVFPKRGDVITLDDVKVEFLYVPDDCSVINTSNGSANILSLIFTIAGKDKKAMITGDAYRRTMQITAWRYADKLKCDILQMPHHALCDTACVEFYRFVDPEIVMLPISSGAYRSMHSKLYNRLEACIANLCVEASAREVYRAFEGNAEVQI